MCCGVVKLVWWSVGTWVGGWRGVRGPAASPSTGHLASSTSATPWAEKTCFKVGSLGPLSLELLLSNLPGSLPSHRTEPESMRYGMFCLSTELAFVRGCLFKGAHVTLYPAGS